MKRPTLVLVLLAASACKVLAPATATTIDAGADTDVAPEERPHDLVELSRELRKFRGDSVDPLVMGSLDEKVVVEVVETNRIQISGCREHQLVRSPVISGKVTVKFLISENGSVTRSQITETTVGNADLETCIETAVRGWTFPKPKGGGVVLVTWPFTFADKDQ